MPRNLKLRIYKLYLFIGPVQGRAKFFKACVYSGKMSVCIVIQSIQRLWNGSLTRRSKRWNSTNQERT